MESKQEIPEDAIRWPAPKVEPVDLHKTCRERITSLEAALRGFSERFCLNHAATLSGDRLKRSDGSCEMCALQSQLAEARSQIEALNGLVEREENDKTLLRELLQKRVNRCDALEAQLADYGKPVTEEEIENVARMMWSFNLEDLPSKNPDEVDIWPEETEERRHVYRLIAKQALMIYRNSRTQSRQGA